ncbi:hypothetical protein PanWU01x14_215020 [Parasponia andersonii]|uniref:Uncharacterized protein n=1 Tax=Parasponia andersonii TaxID=3476 RepID=A0A2P5BS25_PARAD|nr:hypothetical protein PanWU01x14_215020 [Parasponia andersonii]
MNINTSRRLEDPTKVEVIGDLNEVKPDIIQPLSKEAKAKSEKGDMSDVKTRVKRKNKSGQPKEDVIDKYYFHHVGTA